MESGASVALPCETLSTIFSFLPWPQSLGSLQLVCKSWREATASYTLWTSPLTYLYKDGIQIRDWREFNAVTPKEILESPPALSESSCEWFDVQNQRDLRAARREAGERGFAGEEGLEAFGNNPIIAKSPIKEFILHAPDYRSFRISPYDHQDAGHAEFLEEVLKIIPDYNNFEFLKALSQVEVIYINGRFDQLAFAKAAAKYCPNLRRVANRICSAAALETLLLGCSQLQQLCVQPKLVTNNVAEFMANAKFLKELALLALTDSCYGCVETEQCMPASALRLAIERTAESLEILNLTNVDCVTDDLLFFISERCEKLRGITLGHSSSDCAITEVTLEGVFALLDKPPLEMVGVLHIAEEPTERLISRLAELKAAETSLSSLANIYEHYDYYREKLEAAKAKEPVRPQRVQPYFFYI